MSGRPPAPPAAGDRQGTRPRPFDPTGDAVRELCAETAAVSRCCLLAEIAAGLRIAGTVSPQPGQPAVAAVYAGYLPARRLRTAIDAATGHLPLLQDLSAAGPPDGTAGGRRLVVSVTGRGAADLIRTAGLTGPDGRPLVGMPRPAITWRRCDCAAGWRGAFLAAGALRSPQYGRPLLKVACPSREAALALVAAARRLGVRAEPREFGGTCHAAVTAADDITGLLDAIGSPVTAGEWRARWEAGRARAAADRRKHGGPAAMGGPNRSRSERAAAESAARARRALQILGASAPPHLRAVAELRIGNPGLDLSRLGAKAGMSKDAAAARLRQLYKLADARAAALGVPGTGAAAAALAAAS